MEIRSLFFGGLVASVVSCTGVSSYKLVFELQSYDATIGTYKSIRNDLFESDKTLAYWSNERSSINGKAIKDSFEEISYLLTKESNPEVEEEILLNKNKINFMINGYYQPEPDLDVIEFDVFKEEIKYRTDLLIQERELLANNPEVEDYLIKRNLMLDIFSYSGVAGLVFAFLTFCPANPRRIFEKMNKRIFVIPV